MIAVALLAAVLVLALGAKWIEAIKNVAFSLAVLFAGNVAVIFLASEPDAPMLIVLGAAGLAIFTALLMRLADEFKKRNMR